MRGRAEGIGYGNAVPSEAFLQIFRDKQAAAPFSGGRQNDAVPEAESMGRLEFRSTDNHGLGRLDQREAIAPTQNCGTRLYGRAPRLVYKNLDQFAQRLDGKESGTAGESLDQIECVCLLCRAADTLFSTLPPK